MPKVNNIVTTSHSQAAELAALTGDTSALDAKIAELTAQLAAEQEARAKTQAALDAATKTE